MSDTPKPWDGVPENPEWWGYHWLQEPGGPAVACEWDPGDTTGAASWGCGAHWLGRAKVAAKHAYLGPCHTPSEVTTLTFAAWQDGWAAGREVAAKEATGRHWDGHFAPWEVAERIAAAIRALPVPPAPARDGEAG